MKLGSMLELPRWSESAYVCVSSDQPLALSFAGKKKKKKKTPPKKEKKEKRVDALNEKFRL